MGQGGGQGSGMSQGKGGKSMGGGSRGGGGGGGADVTNFLHKFQRFSFGLSSSLFLPLMK